MKRHRKMTPTVFLRLDPHFPSSVRLGGQHERARDPADLHGVTVRSDDMAAEARTTTP